MKKFLCALMAMLMLVGCFTMAVAEEAPIYVRCTGDVNVRTRPSLDGGAVDVAKAGSLRTFMFDASTDERGVVWYRAGDGDTYGWISSKYAELVCGDYALTFDDRGLEPLILGDGVLRSVPDDRGDDLGAFRRGDSAHYRNLYVDLGGKLWYYVECGGASGWMSDRYVEMQYAN